MPMQHALDDIDRKIFRILQKDCKQTSNEIAEQVGLSQTPCLRRIRNMEAAGIIERYTAILNPETLGMHDILYPRLAVRTGRGDR